MAYVIPKENYNGQVLNLDFGKESGALSLGGETPSPSSLLKERYQTGRL